MFRKKESYWPIGQAAIHQLITQKQYNEAQSLLDLWKPINNCTHSWFYLTAKILDHKGEKEKALSMAEIALQKTPAPPEWMALTSKLLMETDRFDQGVDLLGKTVSIDPNQAILWEELGDTFFELKDYSSAMVAYDKCCVALPDRIGPLNKLGNCYLNLEDFSSAGKVFRMVLVKDKKNTVAREGLGKISANRK